MYVCGKPDTSFIHRTLLPYRSLVEGSEVEHLFTCDNKRARAAIEMGEQVEFMSYRSYRTVLSESVYQFVSFVLCRTESLHVPFSLLNLILDPLTSLFLAAFGCLQLHGCLYGAAWGCVTPFPSASSRLGEGVSMRVQPPFASLASVPNNALFFGTILGFQRLCSKSAELVRRREDIGNDLIGFVMLWPYYHYVLNHSERRLVMHNRTVGAALLSSCIYAVLFA